ncbi:MAG: hypothetical protein AAFX93_20035 [Verrucomicrobiota bacterium]
MSDFDKECELGETIMAWVLAAFVIFGAVQYATANIEPQRPTPERLAKVER